MSSVSVPAPAIEITVLPLTILVSDANTVGVSALPNPSKSSSRLLSETLVKVTLPEFGV